MVSWVATKGFCRFARVARAGALAAGMLASALAWADNGTMDPAVRDRPIAQPQSAATVGPEAPVNPPAGVVSPSEAPAATEGAPERSCTREDFETVVDQAAAALRDLNARNKPALQERLRQLKDKRGWTEDQFLSEAAPYVKDEFIDTLDQRTQDLLARIGAMGDEGSAATTPDCNLFATLRAHMNVLVDTQNEKWTYMFRKIDAELAR